MSDMRWSGPQIALFMSLYKTHRALWDPACPDYCRREERDRALASMLSELGELGMPTSMEALKKRMKSYRDTYRNELARIVKSIERGKLHNPKLGWFTIADSFLRNIILGRNEAERLEKLMGSAPIPLMEHGEQLVRLPSLSEEKGSPERDPLAPDPVPQKEVGNSEPPDSPQPSCINSEPPGSLQSTCVNSEPSLPSVCIKLEPPDSPLPPVIKSEPEEELEFHGVQEDRLESPPLKRLKATTKEPLTPTAVRTLKSTETPLTSPLNEPVKRKRGRPPKGTFGPLKVPPVEKPKIQERPPLNPLLKTYRPSPRFKPLMPAPPKSLESVTSNNDNELSTPSSDWLTSQSNTLITSLSNNITSLSNTLIPAQPNTLISTPSNPLITTPSNTLIPTPQNPTHLLLLHPSLETTLNPAQVKLLTPEQMSFLNPGPVNLLEPTTTYCQNSSEEKCPNLQPGKCLNSPTEKRLNTALEKPIKPAPKLPHKPEKLIKTEALEGKLVARTDFLEFGQHVAAQLGQLPLEKALLLQSRIQSLITKERLACICRTQPSEPPPWKQ